MMTEKIFFNNIDFFHGFISLFKIFIFNAIRNYIAYK